MLSMLCHLTASFQLQHMNHVVHKSLTGGCEPLVLCCPPAHHDLSDVRCVHCDGCDCGAVHSAVAPPLKRQRTSAGRITATASALFRLYLSPADFHSFHQCTAQSSKLTKLAQQESLRALESKYGHRHEVHDPTLGRSVRAFVNLKGGQSKNAVPHLQLSLGTRRLSA
jgi:hypothetical protein